jgi:hypothetical protein
MSSVSCDIESARVDKLKAFEKEAPVATGDAGRNDKKVLGESKRNVDFLDGVVTVDDSIALNAASAS